MPLPDTVPAPLHSLLPPSAAASLPTAAHDGAAFDVCRGALALRALLAVNGAVLIGVAVASATWNEVLAAAGPAVAISLVATLAWLCVVCVARRALASRSSAQRVALLMALGAVLTSMASWPLAAIGVLELGASRGLALPMAGAALALPLALWLEVRERARRPADARARLAELQSRIRPHFLFNTLNTAIALVRSDPARAEGVLEDMAELFRVALVEESRGGTVSLASEIELARRYLAIESLRFGDRLELQWQLDPAADAARLPPLALQPLLENAVRHGIEPSEHGGTVRVRTRALLGRVEILIDNTLPQGASTRPGHGLALANVRERLRLLHDLDAQFEAGLHPKQAGGSMPQRWRVRLQVPLGDRP